MLEGCSDKPRRFWATTPFTEEFASSKESHIMMEQPSMLDHLLHHMEERCLRITEADAGEGGKADDEP